MKKKLLILLILSFTCFFANAQTKREVTILYFLPFHLAESFDYSASFRNCADIQQVQQFEMMGFWLGAKMALQEYEHTHKKIHVIVRDAVTDKQALYKVLNDTMLMRSVDIIIGPFYGSLFPIAAEYAKNYCISIINPFSTRFDFVENNPSVYKLLPPFISRPERIEKQFLAQPDTYNVILWGDSTTTPELLAYKYYFNEHHIAYKEIHTLNLPLHRVKSNLIIALFDQQERVIHGVHTLMNNEDQANITLVVPEKWITTSELTDDFFKLPHLYYFTNYFVDENSVAVKEFKYDYLYYYGATATLADYAYQGYDITHYFIDLFAADFNLNEIKFVPLSYRFQWKHIFNGGFENVNARLIQVKNLELEEKF